MIVNSEYTFWEMSQKQRRQPGGCRFCTKSVWGGLFSLIAAHLERFIRNRGRLWHQQTLTLGAKSRGFHLVTDEILG